MWAIYYISYFEPEPDRSCPCFHVHSDTLLLVRSSSDSALVPPLQTAATPTPDENGNAPMEPVSTVR